jgi:hypothetical protein
MALAPETYRYRRSALLVGLKAAELTADEGLAAVRALG